MDNFEREANRLRKEETQTNPLPIVSVILPIRNEERYITKCLESIAQQDYPSNLVEILVVDDMSTDNTRTIVKEFVQKYSNICLVNNPRRIVPAALNIGLQRAKGDIILRVDGHTYLESDYICQCVRYLLNSKEIDNVGGPMRPVGDGLIGKAIALAHCSRFGLGGGRFHIFNKEEFVNTVYLGAYRKELFDRIGLFNEDLACGEEIDLNNRIRSNGGKVLLSPAIKSYYHNRSSLVELWKQFFRNAFWNVKTLQVSPNALSFRHIIPPIFAVSLLTCLIIGIFSPVGISLFFLIVLLYGCLSIIFSFKLALQNGYKYFFAMQAVFFCLHSSYSLGYFAGFLRFGVPLKGIYFCIEKCLNSKTIRRLQI